MNREPSYTNARRVLPPTLLRAVQSRWTGLLWIPARRRRRVKTRLQELRNRRILQARRKGLSLRALARLFLLSKERIRQIVGRVQSGD